MVSYRKDRIIGLLLFLPLVLLIILLCFYPVFRTFRMATYQQGLFQAKGHFVGLENFAKLFQHEAFWRALANTLVFTFGGLSLQMILGLFIALLLNSVFYFRGFVRGTILFSYLVPYVVVALVFRFILSEATGVINYWIRFFQLPIAAYPFGSKQWAMPAVILISAWKNFPFMVIVFLARLQSINPQLYEAADVDGASGLQKFRWITFPSLLPSIMIVGMLRTIWNFNNFEIVFLLTMGGPIGRTETFPLLIYRFAFGEFSMGRGSALATVVLFLLLVMSVGYWKLYDKFQEKLG